MSTLFDLLLLQSPNPTEKEVREELQADLLDGNSRSMNQIRADLKIQWVMDMLQRRYEFCHDPKNNNKLHLYGAWQQMDD